MLRLLLEAETSDVRKEFTGGHVAFQVVAPEAARHFVFAGIRSTTGKRRLMVRREVETLVTVAALRGAPVV